MKTTIIITLFVLSFNAYGQTKSNANLMTFTGVQHKIQSDIDIGFVINLHKLIEEFKVDCYTDSTPVKKRLIHRPHNNSGEINIFLQDDINQFIIDSIAESQAIRYSHKEPTFEYFSRWLDKYINKL